MEYDATDKFTFKTNDFVFENQTEKALSPRNIPASAAIDTIRQIEEKFANGVMEVYEKGINDILVHAKMENMTQKQLSKEIANYNEVFVKEATKEAELFAMDVYEAGLREELSAMGIDRAQRFSQADVSAINLLKEQPKGIFDSIKTFGEEQTKRFGEIITEAYEKPGEFDLDKMVKRMGDASDGSKSSLERIARSETTKISNTARKVQWEEYADTEKKEFHWIIANHPHGDKRTSDICKAIANGGTVKIWDSVKTMGGNPYTLKEIEEITEGFLAHPNCRSTVVRMPMGVD